MGSRGLFFNGKSSFLGGFGMFFWKNGTTPPPSIVSLSRQRIRMTSSLSLILSFSLFSLSLSSSVFQDSCSMMVVDAEINEKEDSQLINKAHHRRPYSRAPSPCAAARCGRCVPEDEMQISTRKRWSKCSGCNAVRYCSLACHQEHWYQHKMHCRRQQRPRIE